MQLNCSSKLYACFTCQFKSQITAISTGPANSSPLSVEILIVIAVLVTVFIIVAVLVVIVVTVTAVLRRSKIVTISMESTKYILEKREFTSTSATTTSKVQEIPTSNTPDYEQVLMEQKILSYTETSNVYLNHELNSSAAAV